MKMDHWKLKHYRAAVRQCSEDEPSLGGGLQSAHVREAGIGKLCVLFKVGMAITTDPTVFLFCTEWGLYNVKGDFSKFCMMLMILEGSEKWYGAHFLSFSFFFLTQYV